MLDVFVADNRAEIVRRCRAKGALRSSLGSQVDDVEFGVPCFLNQLIDEVRHHGSAGTEIGTSASRHGRELYERGFTVREVVHDYGDVCQSITELALERHAPISVGEFRILNRSLDNAIAGAVTGYGSANQVQVAAASIRESERLGFLTHELRNLVDTASVAFEVLKTGDVGIRGSTASVLERTLAALRTLVLRSVDEVRLQHAARVRTHFEVGAFIADLAPAASLAAGVRGLSFHLENEDGDARVHADRDVLTAVVTNLLQNAFKFTRTGSSVTLRGSASAERVLISVADECGGLPDGKIEELFRPFEQQSADRSGLGLGLAMCRWGAEINGGRLSVRDVRDHGCVFTLDLPRG